MKLGELMEERGLEAGDVVAILAERGVLSNAGEAISERGVIFTKGREVPARWARALGVEPPGRPSSEPGEEGGPAAPSGVRSGQAPRRPPEARIEPDPALLTSGARKRIAGAYRFAGAALAAGSGSEGIAAVWGDQADPIAELWVAAAADNPWAAKFVAAMQAGGSAGDLAASHLYLAGATLYVLGAAIPGGDAIFPKYQRYRPVAAAPARNGSAGTGGAAAEPEPEREPAAAHGPAPGPVEFDQG